MKLPAAMLRVGQQRCVSVGGTSVLVCRTEEGVFALENKCTHADSPLYGGTISGNAIRCPLHGAKFHLATGAPLTNLRLAPVKTYQVDIKDDEIVFSAG